LSERQAEELPQAYNKLGKGRVIN